MDIGYMGLVSFGVGGTIVLMVFWNLMANTQLLNWGYERALPWKSYSFWRKMGYEDHGERVATEYGFKVIPLVKELK